MSPKDGPGIVNAAMDPDLGRRLILAPDVDLDVVDSVMRGLGLDRDQGSDPGEKPVVASWSVKGALPVVIWSEKPVFRLQWLDVGCCPPRLRAAMAAALPVLKLDVLHGMLESTKPADVLMAIWALVELEEVVALPELEALGERTVPPIRDEVFRAKAALAAIDADRRELLGGLRLVAAAAGEVIAELTDRRLIDSLLAGPEDCAALFAPDVAGDVAERIARKPHDLGRGTEGKVEDPECIVAAQAGLLRWHNMISRAFPMGYRNIAGWLAPGTVWVTWVTETTPGHTITYDGLVLVDGHWRLFPRPFRTLSKIIPAVGPPCAARR